MVGSGFTVGPRRSLLFVPGSRPDRFEKALACGADIVCVDLEDGVAPALKPAAREAALDFLAGAGGPGAERAVRFNSLRTADGVRDVAQLIGKPAPPGGLLVLAKVDSAQEIGILADILDEQASPLALVPLIETVRGLAVAHDIASASPRNAALLFGAVDLAAELGVPVAHEPLLYARSRMVHAARLAGIGALDVPSLDFRNLDGLQQDCDRARSLGFTGKAMIHPGNAGVINGCFSPSPQDIEHARAVLAAFAASPTGLVVIDGKLIEKPVVRAMEQILARAKLRPPQ